MAAAVLAMAAPGCVANSQGAATAPAAPPTATEPIYAVPTQHDRIGRILAPVTINGRGPYRFVLDTGASVSTLSPRLALELGLVADPNNPLLLHGVTGFAPLPAVRLQRLRSGSIVRENELVPIIEASIMSNSDGILGVAGLSEERISIDFRADEFSIAQSRGRFVAAGYIRVPARRLSGGLLAVRTKVGDVRAIAVIDTGAERTLGNLALRKALLGNNATTDPDARTEVFGATSQLSAGDYLLAPPIHISDVEVSNVNIVFGEFHIFDVWRLTKRPALILGMDVLGSLSSLVIDYRRNEIQLRP